MYQRVRKLLNPKVQLVLKVIASVGLVTLLLAKLDLHYLALLPYKIDSNYLLLAVLFTAIFVALRIAKWREITISNRLAAPVSGLSRLFLVSLAVGAVTPVRAGEITRVVVFPSDSRAKAAALFLYDRMADLWFILLCAVAGSYQISLALFISLLAATIVLGSILFSVRSSLRVLEKVRPFDFIREKIQSLVSAAESVNLYTRSYWLLTMFAYVFGYLAIAALVRSFTPVDSWWFVLLLPLITLSNIFLVTIAGLGIREGLASLVLPIAGIAPEVAATSFFLSFVLSVLLPGIIGLCWNTALTFKKRSVATKNDGTNADRPPGMHSRTL